MTTVTVTVPMTEPFKLKLQLMLRGFMLRHNKTRFSEEVAKLYMTLATDCGEDGKKPIEQRLMFNYIIDYLVSVEPFVLASLDECRKVEKKNKTGGGREAKRGVKKTKKTTSVTADCIRPVLKSWGKDTPVIFPGTETFDVVVYLGSNLVTRTVKAAFLNELADLYLCAKTAVTDTLASGVSADILPKTAHFTWAHVREVTDEKMPWTEERISTMLELDRDAARNAKKRNIMAFMSGILLNGIRDDKKKKMTDLIEIAIDSMLSINQHELRELQQQMGSGNLSKLQNAEVVQRIIRRVLKKSGLGQSDLGEYDDLTGVILQNLKESDDPNLRRLGEMGETMSKAGNTDTLADLEKEAKEAIVKERMAVSGPSGAKEAVATDQKGPKTVAAGTSKSSQSDASATEVGPSQPPKRRSRAGRARKAPVDRHQTDQDS